MPRIQQAHLLRRANKKGLGTVVGHLQAGGLDIGQPQEDQEDLALVLRRRLIGREQGRDHVDVHHRRPNHRHGPLAKDAKDHRVKRIRQHLSSGNRLLPRHQRLALEGRAVDAAGPEGHPALGPIGVASRPQDEHLFDGTAVDKADAEAGGPALELPAREGGREALTQRFE